jgi:PEGA domain-containing protein
VKTVYDDLAASAPKCFNASSQLVHRQKKTAWQNCMPFLPQLSPGEYVVSRAHSQSVFCFGVDYAPWAVRPGPQIIADEPKGIVVRFTSTPPDAEVNIDGEYWGSTPTEDLTRTPPGPHTILIKKTCYQPWEQKITLAPGDDRTISAELQAQPNDPNSHVSGN